MKIDYEDIMNYTSVNSETEPTTGLEDSWMDRIALDHLILFALSTAAFFADLAIILTMLCFKQMRTAPNMFIVSWAILDIYAVLTPVGYRLVSILSDTNACFLLQMSFILRFLIIASVFIIFGSWCIMAYFSKFSKWIGVYYKVMMAIIWGILLIFLIILSTGCLDPEFDENAEKGCSVMLAPLLIFIITVHFVNVLKKRRGQSLEHSQLSLTLCTAFMVCNALGVATSITMPLLGLENPPFNMIPASFVFCNSVVTFSVLFYYDKPFQLHARKILQRKCREIERSHVEGERIERGQSPEVSFHCPTEELRTNK